MITCKEDLMNKYAVRADKKVFGLFMDACEKYGVTWSSGSAAKDNVYGEAASTIHGEAASTIHGDLGHAHVAFYIDNGYTKLTLSDFQPDIKTKVEYVHIKSNDIAFWEIAKEFAESDICNIHFLSVHDDMVEVACNDILLSNYKSRNLYRKVETEITWRDELEEFLDGSLTCHDSDSPWHHVSDDWVKFDGKFNNKDFIAMCHLVSNANKGK